MHTFLCTTHSHHILILFHSYLYVREPVDEFSYPVAEIPISVLVPDNLQMEHFDDMQVF